MEVFLTALIILNMKGEEAKSGIEINIGQTKICSQKSAKLLGMNLQNDLNWSEHINGKGGIISSLNRR